MTLNLRGNAGSVVCDHARWTDGRQNPGAGVGCTPLGPALTEGLGIAAALANAHLYELTARNRLACASGVHDAACGSSLNSRPTANDAPVV